jgi:phosphoribosylanthranilate isomerase
MFVKICGITTEKDALLAIALGADALGFVFAPGSPRMVTVDEATDIVKHVPYDEVLTLGVFRDERPERVAEIVNRVGLKGAQLHGRESAAEVVYVRQRVPLVVQGFAAGDPAISMASEGPADVVLLDAPDPGSGRVFDWVQIDGALDGVRLLLAGGLTPDNVAEAIRRVRPWGVDVSTGVETAPGSGRKDPRKLRRFIQAARAASAALEHRSSPNGGIGHQPYDWQAEGA